MRIRTLLLAPAMLQVLSAACPADPVSGSAPAALSPAFQSAMNALYSDDYSARKKAIQQLEAQVREEDVAMASSKDPEVQASLQKVLEFDGGLTQYLVDSLKLPEEQRLVRLRMGANATLAPILARIFAVDSSKRAPAVLALSGFEEPGVDPLLAQLVDDPDRQVSLSAMEALWDRTPTDVTTNVLWMRAVQAGLDQLADIQAEMNQTVTFRGRRIPSGFGPSAARRTQDDEIACEVLEHQHSPELQKKLQELFSIAAQAVAEGKPENLRRYSGNAPAMKNAYRLAESYDPQPLIPDLFQLATCADVEKMNIPLAGKIFLSNKTRALQAIIVMTHQKPSDYLLKCISPQPELWAPATEADEASAVAQLQLWWRDHAKNYVAPQQASPVTNAGP